MVSALNQAGRKQVLKDSAEIEHLMIAKDVKYYELRVIQGVVNA